MGVSVPDLIKAKLEATNLSDGVELRLTGEYAAREFVVQYKESDLAFVSRLAEHLGISFFFEQGEAGETMVFTDHGSGFGRTDEGRPVAFRAHGAHLDVFALEAKRRMIPTFYAVCDYNYRKPLLDITGEHEIESGFAGGVIEYGTHHKTLERARRSRPCGPKSASRPSSFTPVKARCPRSRRARGSPSTATLISARSSSS